MCRMGTKRTTDSPLSAAERGAGGVRPAGVIRRKRLMTGAPVGLWLPALVVALLMVSPLVYLVIRASEGGWELLDLLWRERTARVLRNTVYLAVLVTGGTVAVSLPLAWLTMRTDLPWRRFWTIATAL